VKRQGTRAEAVFQTVSRRRKPGALEQLLLAFVDLPLWAALVAAPCIYLSFTYLTPQMPHNSMVGSVLSSIFPMVAPFFSGAILLAGFVGVAKRRYRRRLLAGAGGITSIRQLGWADLELLVGEAYRRQGFVVTERGGNQPDGGIDLELERNGERTLVQCKQWTRPVPVERVRELLGVVTREQAARGILVAPAGFTPDARGFAKGMPLELLDGDAVLRLTAGSTVPHQVEPVWSEPVCPTCGKSMVQRTARKGPHAGSEFWGCSAYPACHGMRAA